MGVSMGVSMDVSMEVSTDVASTDISMVCSQQPLCQQGQHVGNLLLLQDPSSQQLPLHCCQQQKHVQSTCCG